jgi:hypothetical protein
MIINMPKKGDILVYTSTDKQKAINPNDLLVYTGVIIEDSQTKEKKVASGTPIQLGVLLSTLVDDRDNIAKELNELKISYRKNIKKLVSIIEILANQTALNNMQINDLKNIQKEVKDEE